MTVVTGRWGERRAEVVHIADGESFTIRVELGQERIALTMRGGAVDVRWRGEMPAVVARYGEIIHRTVPQIGAWKDDTAGPWFMQAGDLIFIGSREIHDAIRESDFERIANREDESVIVRALLTTTITRGTSDSLFVVAIRVRGNAP